MYSVLLLPKILKRCSLGALVVTLFIFLVIKFSEIKNPSGQNSLLRPSPVNISDSKFHEVQNANSSSQLISRDILVSDLFVQRNLPNELQSCLMTWNHMNLITEYALRLPNAVEAIREAVVAWNSLLNITENEQKVYANETSVVGSKEKHANKTSVVGSKEKQCPRSLTDKNATEFGNKISTLQIPCGLVQGSAITIIGIPRILGDFRIDLMGEPLAQEPNPPVVLHYNVQLNGDKITRDPVIVQNTWTAAHGWGEEERCPSATLGNNKDGKLIQCSQMVGKDGGQNHAAVGSSNASMQSSLAQKRFKHRQYFPFKQGYLSVMTLRAGEEGFQMTVDGKQTTYFSYRERLEPWLVNQVQISGDLDLISVFASGLHTSDDLEDNVDLEALRSAPLPAPKKVDLLIGVFSTANNFKQRMAVRRTWMQYAAVRSGTVAVRFFVGLHKNQIVNKELWNEVGTYRDIQMMPFVDYYSLITWKTVAICTYGSQVVSAKYVMKTDDDSFIRVDEIIASLQHANVTRGLLYGLIDSNARPQRNKESKWYISLEEWQEETYPPWAHGPGYVVSHDIAEGVYKRYRTGRLKMFKLEDVAMGIWIAEMRKEGLEINYRNEERVYIEGCKERFIVAHYQSPREMLCLWQNLQEVNYPKCCAVR